jgi:hypothetical protein
VHPVRQMSKDAPFAEEVRGYLADCAAAPGLSPKYHPTAEGALKVIFHRGKAEESQIRDAYTDERKKRR